NHQSTLNDRFHLPQFLLRQGSNEPVAIQASIGERRCSLAKICILCERLPVKRVRTIECAYRESAFRLVKFIFTSEKKIVSLRILRPRCSQNLRFTRREVCFQGFCNFLCNCALNT